VVKRFLLACGALAISAVTLLAADVAGTWKVEGDVYGNPVAFTTVLKQEGETLSGTATLDGKDVPVTGTVKDTAVTFEFDADANGTVYHMVFVATLGQDGALKGAIQVAGVEGSFTATKQ
jgi:hypothetical protein